MYTLESLNGDHSYGNCLHLDKANWKINTLEDLLKVEQGIIVWCQAHEQYNWQINRPGYYASTTIKATDSVLDRLGALSARQNARAGSMDAYLIYHAPMGCPYCYYPIPSAVVEEAVQATVSLQKAQV